MAKTISPQNPAATSQMDSENEVTNLYYSYKEAFTAYMLKNHSIDEEMVADIYQESFLVLYQDIRSGKLQDPQSTTLKSYLFRIGINKALKYFEQQRKMPTTNIEELFNLTDTDDSEIQEKKDEIARKVVSEMEELCKKVLSFYFWERKSMHEIAKLMNYKNEQVAKNRKFICQQALRERLKDIFIKEGWI